MSVDQPDPGRGHGGGDHDADVAAAPAADPPGESASAPPPASDPPREVTPRRLLRAVTLVLLVLVGLAGVGGGGFSVARELTRHATGAEQAAAVQAEIASRWQRLAAGKIFPATFPYTTSDFGATMTARRVGIAPRATCATALDPAVASLLRKWGCVTVLRATYVDASGTLAVTAGIAVMPSVGAADRVVDASDEEPAQAGVLTFGLPGTLADQFGNAQRRAFGSIQSLGPYIFLYAAGYTDGRVSGSATSTPALGDLGSGVTVELQTVLTSHGSVCGMRDIRC